ncbi:MAG: hypothetical protein WDO17_07895 [Alphaproteobacteria bacterium]
MNRGFGAPPDDAITRLYKVAAENTDEGKERIRAYYEALGRFVDTFARVESVVTQTLWKYANTPSKIGKVIFSGARIENGSQYIKQLAEATGAPQESRDDLENALQQLGIISRVRN